MIKNNLFCLSFIVCFQAIGSASSVTQQNFQEGDIGVLHLNEEPLNSLTSWNAGFPFNKTPHCHSVNGEKGVTLNAIFLTGSESPLSQEEKNVLIEMKHIYVKNVEIPDGIENFRKFLEPLFLGNCLTSELIVDIKKTIIRYFRTHGHPIIAIDVPEQDITDGILHLIITEGKLNEILTRGNHWFSSKLLKSYIRLKPGEEIDSDILLEDIAWMNRNPFHTTDLIFSPGSQEGTTDIELLTKDRFPLRLYVGGDNTGTVETGEARVFAGFNWANAFGCDQQLTYQATFSADGNKFRANTVNYVAPLPWRHILQIYGGYAVVRPRHHTHPHEFHSKGHSFQSSLRYTIPVPPTYKGKEREWLWGIDYKNTNNNLEFIEAGERPIIANEVNIFQLMMGYNLGIAPGRNQFSFSGELFVSPIGFLPHQSNRYYSQLRSGAKASYAYGRLMLSDTYQFPQGWGIFFQTRGQISSTSLLPNEQLGLGGYDTVRGYDEREINADSGCCGNLEFRTPPFPIFCHWKKFKDQFYLLAFTDYGLSIEYTHESGRVHTQQLLSAGPGVRYRMGNYISLRGDLGYRFIAIEGGQDKGWKVHLGALITY